MERVPTPVFAHRENYFFWNGNTNTFDSVTAEMKKTYPNTPVQEAFQLVLGNKAPFYQLQFQERLDDGNSNPSVPFVSKKHTPVRWHLSVLTADGSFEELKKDGYSSLNSMFTAFTGRITEEVEKLGGTVTTGSKYYDYTAVVPAGKELNLTFKITWEWPFESGSGNTPTGFDTADTLLGILAAAEVQMEQKRQDIRDAYKDKTEAEITTILEKSKDEIESSPDRFSVIYVPKEYKYTKDQTEVPINAGWNKVKNLPQQSCIDVGFTLTLQITQID